MPPTFCHLWMQTLTGSDYTPNFPEHYKVHSLWLPLPRNAISMHWQQPPGLTPVSSPPKTTKIKNALQMPNNLCKNNAWVNPTSSKISLKFIPKYHFLAQHCLVVRQEGTELKLHGITFSAANKIATKPRIKPGHVSLHFYTRLSLWCMWSAMKEVEKTVEKKKVGKKVEKNVEKKVGKLVEKKVGKKT